MSSGVPIMLMIAGFVAFVLEIGVFVAIGYGALRFATRFLRMRQDIEELKVAVRELRGGA
jgi:hypothetical protein